MRQPSVRGTFSALSCIFNLHAPELPSQIFLKLICINRHQKIPPFIRQPRRFSKARTRDTDLQPSRKDDELQALLYRNT